MKKIEKGVLHFIYKEKTDIPPEIIDFADAYEGSIPNRIGFNIPVDFMTKHDPKHPFVKDCMKQKIKYVIVYKKGDILTKNHEMCHAKYGMDENYRNNVKKMWDSYDDPYKKKVRKILKRMHYPENENILLDEFQAYFFTEKEIFDKI